MAGALGRAGISIEGGGAWCFGGRAVAHFLFDAAAPVAQVLRAEGITVLAEQPVVTLRLDQARPGQLGAAAAAMAAAGVNLRVQYSDHDHRLVLVADDPATAARVAAEWMRRRPGHPG